MPIVTLFLAGVHLSSSSALPPPRRTVTFLFYSLALPCACKNAQKSRVMAAKPLCMGCLKRLYLIDKQSRNTITTGFTG